jgi:hypothetical protein
MTKLTEEYLISDLGLSKICKKLNVPVPGRGYWAKERKGDRPPLLPSKGVWDYVIHTVEREETAEETTKKKMYSPDIEAMLSFEERPENLIIVSERLYSAHPLVERTKHALKKAKPNTIGHLTVLDKKCLDVSIRRGSVDRAMRIYDALIKGLIFRCLTKIKAIPRSLFAGKH